MDTQNIHTFFSVNMVGYYMSEVKPVQSNQVEAFQPHTDSFGKYIQNIAGQTAIVPQFSNVNDGKYLDGRDVIETALQITADAARSTDFDIEIDTKVTSLFKKLNGKNGITFDANENKLHYKDLEITVSVVNKIFEANIFMRGCNDVNTLKAAIQDFYNAAEIKQTDGRFAMDGIFFPAIDAKDEDLRHYYSTNDYVIIDQYAFKAIDIAFKQFGQMMILPQFFTHKRDVYSNNSKLQSATEQQLAFTHEQMREISNLLRELLTLRAQSAKITLQPNEVIIDRDRLFYLENVFSKVKENAKKIGDLFQEENLL